MTRTLAALGPAFLVLTGCGYVGNPLPPLANVPAPVTELAAVQRESRIIVHFKLPASTTESFPIKSELKVDLRIGPAAEGPFRAAEWAAQAQTVPPGEIAAGVATFSIPSASWTGRSVVIGARVIGANGKASDWTALESLPVVPPPEKPGTPTIDNTPEGLRLVWDGPPGEFRIYRKADGEKDFAPVADVAQREWVDRATASGSSYTYIVQRIVKLGLHHEAESEPSAENRKMAEDKFPPAAPSGLRASPAAGSIELSWERNLEPDLGGYRVYRAAAGGPFEKIADVSQIPSYSDRGVKSGQGYRYAVTAVDKLGNESGQSAAAEATVQ